MPLENAQKASVIERAKKSVTRESVDLTTGHRKLFKELAPANRTGLLSMRDFFLTGDLNSYAYTTYYQVSSLFVSEPSE